MIGKLEPFFEELDKATCLSDYCNALYCFLKQNDIAELLKKHAARALEQGDKTVILISIDTSGLGSAFTRRVREEIHREIGVDPQAIMVSAIHIHTGGPQLMEVFWGQKEDKEVTDMFLRETVAAAVEAYRNRVPATARFAMGFEDSISFCRRGLVSVDICSIKERKLSHCSGERISIFPFLPNTEIRSFHSGT